MSNISGSPGFPADESVIREYSASAYDRGFHPSGQVRQLAAVLAQPNRASALQSVDVPTLVIHGAEDPLVNPSGGKATADAIPNAKFKIVPGMGHDLPPALYEEIVDSLAKILFVLRFPQTSLLRVTPVFDLVELVFEPLGNLLVLVVVDVRNCLDGFTMTRVVRVDKCVAVHWCGAVVVTLRRAVNAKKGEEAKTAKTSDEGGTHGAKRRSPHNTTGGCAVSATSSAGSATSHMNRPLDWVR